MNLPPRAKLPLRIHYFRASTRREVRPQIVFFRAIMPIIGNRHMNKRLWNGVYFNQDVPDDVILRLVRNSCDLIVAKLTKKERVELETRTDE